MNEKIEQQPNSSEEQGESETDSDSKQDESIEVSRSEWDNLKDERDEFHDKYMRKMADLQNLRKRKQQEKKEYVKYAHRDMARDLLEVIDNFDRALENMEFENESARDGIQMIREQMLDLLERHHVQSMDAQGDPFDPHRHEALAQEEREDLDQEKVVEVFREGYTLHDRVLRPAGVKVGVPADQTTSDSTDDTPSLESEESGSTE